MVNEKIPQPVTYSRTLIQITPNLPSWSVTNSWSFGKSKIGEKLRKMYQKGGYYKFLMTTANLNADQFLREYVIEKKEDTWGNPRQLAQGEKADFSPDAEDTIKRLSFRPSLMDLYLSTLEQQALETLGEGSYAQFPLVETQGVHNIDRLTESVYYPTVHVVRGNLITHPNKFRTLVHCLNGQKARSIIGKKEAPQNYRIPEVDLLRGLNIAPLNISAEECDFDSEVLRNVINFLAPFMLSCEHTEDRLDED